MAITTIRVVSNNCPFISPALPFRRLLTNLKTDISTAPINMALVTLCVILNNMSVINGRFYSGTQTPENITGEII